MTRYKAILFTEERLERVRQTFGNDLGPIYNWAERILKEYKGTVKIYETKTELIDSISDSDLALSSSQQSRERLGPPSQGGRAGTSNS